jgi:hypothetical protein
MKVYLAWNDGDYYGPDPVGNLVYASLEAAQHACEAETYFRKAGAWVARKDGHLWHYDRDNYYVEEVEVEA